MTRKDATKLFIRFLIVFACVLPVLIVIGLLLTDKISDFVMVIIFVVIAGGVLAIEELIHFKLRQKREMLKQNEIEMNKKKK